MVHGIGQTQIIVQQVEDITQSVEKMVRIKQTLIESMQTGGNNQQHQRTDKESAGPIIKGLDEALQSFNIHRQQYLVVC